MRVSAMPGWRVSLITIAAASLLSACGGGGGSSSSNEDKVPPLPEAAGEAISQRYQPLGESAAIVLDTQTNLAWKRCYHGQSWNPELSACDGTAETLAWDVARNLIDKDGFRLASLAELQSLVYCNNVHATPDQIGNLDIFEGCGSPTLSPTIDPAAFPDMRQLTVWTSDESPNSDTTRLGINFSTGVISDFNSPGANYRLILVRNPEDGDDPRAADGARPRTVEAE